jgi:hypothetical protein
MCDASYLQGEESHSAADAPIVLIVPWWSGASLSYGRLVSCVLWCCLFWLSCMFLLGGVRFVMAASHAYAFVLIPLFCMRTSL